MAVAKTARVLATEAIGLTTRHLTLELSGDEPLGFTGGQYIIIDSGLVSAAGKAVKRAFSILSEDGDQTSFELAALRLSEGPGSGYLHGLAPGEVVRFSGPWGKMTPAEAPAETLILATDTGITAALGLVRAARFAPSLPVTTLVWLNGPEPFLPEAFVRARVPAALGAFETGALPPAGHPERVPHALAVVERLPARGRLARAYAAGDGAVNYALIDALAPAGVAIDRDRVESFFNAPKKTAAAPASPGSPASQN